MYSTLQLALKYAGYYLKAANGKGHGMHSPFVFDFILDVLNNRQNYHPGSSIEELRARLLKDNTTLLVEDFGAGSRTGQKKTRMVKDIAKSALKPKKFVHLLYRLVKKYQPASIIELGTSLGISTAYLSMGNPSARIITIEGAPAIHGMALNHFKELGLTNIDSLQGKFDDLLPGALESLGKIDMVYIDGNHRKEPTLHYFNLILPYIHNNTILVFDDIHWSREMEEAWEIIKNNGQVTCSIDIFFVGFAFFRPGFSEKQQFTIRF